MLDRPEGLLQRTATEFYKLDKTRQRPVKLDLGTGASPCYTTVFDRVKTRNLKLHIHLVPYVPFLASKSCFI